MFLRSHGRSKDGKDHTYWSLVCRRSAKLTQQGSAKMTQAGNSAGIGVSSSTPKACRRELGDGRYYPRRRRAGCSSIIRAEGAHQEWEVVPGLPLRRDAFEPIAEVSEVVRADVQFQHFLNHG